MQKEKSQLKIGIVLNYLNMAMGTLIPIFYTPIMLQLLGQNEYGLYKLSGSVTSYLNLISLGLGSAVSRYLIKAKVEQGEDAEERTLGLFVIVFQIIAVVSFIFGVILVFNLHLWYDVSLTVEELNKMRIIVFVLVCNTAISFAVSPYMSVVSTHEKFVFLQVMNIFSTCMTPIVNLMMLCLGYKSIGMAVSSLAMSVLGQFIYMIYIRKKLNVRAQYRDVPFSMLKEIMTFSFWVFVANIVSQLYNSTDTVMIGAIPALGTVGVAIYNVGTTFSSLTTTLTIGVSSLMSPKTSKMVFGGATNNELTDLAIRVGRLQGYIVTLIVTGFVAFGQPFISWYAGEKYTASYWVAIFLLIPSMIPLVQSVCLSIITAQNKHKFRSIVYLGIAIINIIGTWFMMKWMGVIGAALMTGVATMLGQGIVMNWYYAKKIKLEMRRFWKSLLSLYPIPICLCVTVLISSKWINFYNLGTMIVSIMCYTFLYCVLSWKFVLNEYEKSLIVEPINKLKGKLKKV